MVNLGIGKLCSSSVLLCPAGKTSYFSDYSVYENSIIVIDL